MVAGVLYQIVGIISLDSREEGRNIGSSEKDTTDSDDDIESSDIGIDKDDLLKLLNDVKCMLLW